MHTGQAFITGIDSLEYTFLLNVISEIVKLREYKPNQINLKCQTLDIIGDYHMANIWKFQKTNFGKCQQTFVNTVAKMLSILRTC